MHFFKGSLSIFVFVAGIFIFGHFVPRAETASKDLILDRFPAEVSNSWEYRRTFYAVILDTASGDTLQENFMVDSLHSEFKQIDTVHSWECYKYVSRLFSGAHIYSDTAWFAHPDTSFLEIAYTTPTHAGPPLSSSGTLRLKFKERSFSGIDELKLYLYQMRGSGLMSTSSETSFWNPPKKLFVYPLAVGAKWISMLEPWKEEREVMAEEVVQVPAGTFATLRIDLRPIIKDLSPYQWISEQGVIKDSIYYDTSLVANQFGGIIGYWFGYDKYELVDQVTAVKEQGLDNGISSDFSLSQNYPNPFNPTTTIHYTVRSSPFTVHSPTPTSLIVYNILGQKVRTLMDELKKTGNYKVIWDGKDDQGQVVGSGIYFYRLKVDEYTETKKMLLLK